MSNTIIGVYPLCGIDGFDALSSRSQKVLSVRYCEALMNWDDAPAIANYYAGKKLKCFPVEYFVRNITLANLNSIWGCGPTTLTEIRAWIEFNGFKLRKKGQPLDGYAQLDFADHRAVADLPGYGDLPKDARRLLHEYYFSPEAFSGPYHPFHGHVFAHMHEEPPLRFMTITSWRTHISSSDLIKLFTHNQAEGVDALITWLQFHNVID